MIAGNLTRDPELRHTPSGVAVCEVSVATNRKYTDKDGQEQEEATFVEVTLWNKTAEAMGKYGSRGRAVCFEGRLKLDKWEDKETGAKRSKLRVVAERFDFTDPKPTHHGASGDNSAGVSRPASSTTVADDDEDDIPF